MEVNRTTPTEPGMTSNDLAFERTVLAENRTLMAWVRTAVSMISFGFTIYKFFHETEGISHKLLTPRLVGMAMITIGMLCLIWGLLDHRSMLSKLRKSYPSVGPSRTAWLAVIILIFGIGLFLGAFFRQ